MDPLEPPTTLRIRRAWLAAQDCPLPVELGEVLKIAPANHPALLPLYGHAVAAGFPSPADDHLQAVISLDEELIDHPAATFMARVKGNSMRDANICDGDVLIVDRAIAPAHGHVVIAVVDGELTVKRLWSKGGRVKLMPSNPDFPEIEIHDGQELMIWGVVTSTIRRLLRVSR